jgi:UPF0716 protein FxsA
MRTFPIFAVLFLVIPIIEIYVLIQVGSVIGALPTIILVVATAVIGAFLLRQQGLSTFMRFQQNMATGQLPAKEMVEGVMLLVGGALLMTPGFFTDTIGFFCLIPFTRQWIANFIINKSMVQVQSKMADGMGEGNGGFSYTQQTYHQQGDANIVEGEFTEKPDGRLNKD